MNIERGALLSTIRICCETLSWRSWSWLSVIWDGPWQRIQCVYIYKYANKVWHCLSKLLYIQEHQLHQVCLTWHIKDAWGYSKAHCWKQTSLSRVLESIIPCFDLKSSIIRSAKTSRMIPLQETVQSSLPYAWLCINDPESVLGDQSNIFGTSF